MCNCKPTPVRPSLMIRFFEAIMRPLYKLRPRTVSGATGDVLEVGSGTGLNLDLYGEIASLTGIEPDVEAMKLAKQRAQGLPWPVKLLEVGAESMPFEDEQFDSVVVTWVFCTIPELEKAIAEIWRVMKPGAKLFYVEHVRSPHRSMGWLQDRLTPVWKRVAGGCHLNRTPRQWLEEAGLRHLEFKVVQASVWNPFPMIAGVVEKPLTALETSATTEVEQE